MKTITLDLEKVLTLIINNEDNDQNNLGNNDGVVIINPLNHVEYHYPSPGTYYPNCHVIDPEDFIDMDEIEKEYSLDLVDFRTTAIDILKEETGKDYEDLTEEDWEKISGYINEWIDEWKQYARAEKRDTIKIENSQGEVVEEYNIEWA